MPVECTYVLNENDMSVLSGYDSALGAVVDVPLPVRGHDAHRTSRQRHTARLPVGQLLACDSSTNPAQTRYVRRMM